MASRVVTVDSHAFGDSISVPLLDSRWSRRNASWTMSSASLALPSIRYAIENNSGRRCSYTISLFVGGALIAFMFSL
jgi:hypothetical protein